MAETQICHHCQKDFETDYGLDYGVIHFHGQIEGYICPQCLKGARNAFDILNRNGVPVINLLET